MRIQRFILVFGASIGVALPILPILGLVIAPSTQSTASTSIKQAALGTNESFWLTLALATAVSALALSTGTLLAWLERRFEYPGRKFLSAMCLLPLAVPSYVLAGTLRESLGPGGLGLRSFSGFWAAVCVLSLATIPLVQLLVSAALTRIPIQEEEAARSLGASPWRAFKVATLPRLRPSLTYSLLLTQLYVISDFGAVAMLNVPSLTWRLYLAVNTQQNIRALILGLALFVVSIPLFFVAQWLMGRHEHGETVANPKSNNPRKLRGAALDLTYILQISIAMLGVCVPVISLIFWITSGESEASLWTPLKDTSIIAILGATITVILAFFPAWLIARNPSSAMRWLERAVYLSSAMPGVLLAFGLLLIALATSRLVDPEGNFYYMLTGSGLLLMIGYATRFIAEAYSSLKTNILKLSLRQKETARALGAGLWKQSRYITGPALLPGIATAFIICLLAIMKELPVTLILSGAMGLHTLSFRMFDRYQDAFLPDAG